MTICPVVAEIFQSKVVDRPTSRPLKHYKVTFTLKFSASGVCKQKFFTPHLYVFISFAAGNSVCDAPAEHPPGCQDDPGLSPLTPKIHNLSGVFASCLDRLPASQNRGDVAGQVTGERAKQRVRFHRPSINQTS